MKILHIDPFAGISGDMTVSALRDLGVEESVFQKALSALPITLPRCRFERGDRGGIAGWRFCVSGHDGPSTYRFHKVSKHSQPSAFSLRPYSHHPHPHGHNHTEIITLLKQSSLDPEVKNRSLAVFQRIAIAEGGIHGVPPETVGFHEVGAEDSIADIVAACAGLVSLNLDAISCGPLTEGMGQVQCAHGIFPLPAPATLALLKNIPFRQVEEPWEHITPTGAALLAEFVTSFGPLPEMAVTAIGYGLGSRKTPNRPNALRLILGTSTGRDVSSQDEVIELRCNLDDLTPEHAACALDVILTAGALDATLTPTVMKKGRSGWILEVLCSQENAETLSELILRQTSAFGVRRHAMQRLKLQRHHRTVETIYGPIAVKIGTRNGEIIQQSPEFSSCSEASLKYGIPVRLVHAAALRAL
jgi:uncharacterized protein (TIGR00299 family) protein